MRTIVMTVYLAVVLLGIMVAIGYGTFTAKYLALSAIGVVTYIYYAFGIFRWVFEKWNSDYDENFDS